MAPTQVRPMALVHESSKLCMVHLQIPASIFSDIQLAHIHSPKQILTFGNHIVPNSDWHEDFPFQKIQLIASFMQFYGVDLTCSFLRSQTWAWQIVRHYDLLQAKFFEALIIPLYNELVKVYPACQPLLTQCTTNWKEWDKCHGQMPNLNDTVTIGSPPKRSPLARSLPILQEE